MTTVREFLKRSHALVTLVRLAWSIRSRLARPRRIRDYLATNAVRRLQLGAEGGPLPGWLCVDHRRRGGQVVYLDASRPFPFDDAVFDYIFSEHLIEHFSWGDGGHMLSECLRVLRPGGTLRITTPDLASVLSLYDGTDDPGKERYTAWQTDHLGDTDLRKPQFAINNAFYGYGHQFLYDGEILELALQKAGFAGIARRQCGESPDPYLHGLDSHMTFVTMAYETKRPD